MDWCDWLMITWLPARSGERVLECVEVDADFDGFYSVAWLTDLIEWLCERIIFRSILFDWFDYHAYQTDRPPILVTY